MLSNLQAFERFNTLLGEVELPLLCSFDGGLGGNVGKVGVLASVVQELGELLGGQSVSAGGLRLGLESLVELTGSNVTKKASGGLGACRRNRHVLGHYGRNSVHDQSNGVKHVLVTGGTKLF